MNYTDNKLNLANTKLRLIILGGESINERDVKNFTATNSNIRVINHYGPTETTVGCISTLADYETIDFSKNVIGKPLGNTKAYILDKYDNVVDIGISAQLCISGDGLARGYLNNPELTKERFVDNPFEVGHYII